MSVCGSGGGGGGGWLKCEVILRESEDVITSPSQSLRHVLSLPLLLHSPFSLLPPFLPSSLLCSLTPDQMRQYFTQLRQELGYRLVDRVYGSDDKPSKVSRHRERFRGRGCKAKDMDRGEGERDSRGGGVKQKTWTGERV